MTSIAHDRYCDEVVAQTELLRAALDGTDLSMAVPTCPAWTLADLVRHIGGNLHSAETAVRTGTAVRDAAEQVPAAAGPAGDDPAELDRWLAGAAARYAGTLRAAGADGRATVWGTDQDTAFWARRAAHDIVIHRADAALALGAPYALDADLAADAIDELLDLFIYLQAVGAAPDLAELGGAGKSIHLHATDAETEAETRAEWLIELAAKDYTWQRRHGKATVALRGPLTDLLLVMYRRLPPTAERVEVLGDRGLLDGWLARVSLG